MRAAHVINCRGRSDGQFRYSSAGSRVHRSGFGTLGSPATSIASRPRAARDLARTETFPLSRGARSREAREGPPDPLAIVSNCGPRLPGDRRAPARIGKDFDAIVASAKIGAEWMKPGAGDLPQGAQLIGVAPEECIPVGNPIP